MEINIQQAAQMNIKNHTRQYVAKDGTVFKCVHEDGCYKHLGTIVENYNPEIVVELGTSWGGLTKLFEDYAPNAIIFSFDRPKAPRKPDIHKFSPRVNFIRQDVLTMPPNSYVGDLCKLRGRKILYCDNGCKVREVIYYAPSLRRGDVLAVHDWPREIYTDYDLLKPAARRHVTREDINTLSAVLSMFRPIWHEKFLSLGFSTRFWVKNF